MKTLASLQMQGTGEDKFVNVLYSDGTFCLVRATDKVLELVSSFQKGEISVEQLCKDLEGFASSFVTPENTAQEIMNHIQHVSRHISTDGVHVYYDNETFEEVQLDPILEKHIIRLLLERADGSEKAEYDWRCWIAFTEKLYGNVDPDIRKQLVSWLEKQNMLTFTEDGCLIGYRGCRKNKNDVPVSVHAGYGIVNGVEMNGHLPNEVGNVIEMPRFKVEHNPSVGCGSGLHVGTYNYAKDFCRDCLVRVKVDPQDIVSVPFDCAAEKIRCCRFEVLDVEECVSESGYDLSEMSYGYDPDEDELCEDFDDYDDEYDPDDYDDDYDDDDFDTDAEYSQRDPFLKDAPIAYSVNADGTEDTTRFRKQNRAKTPEEVINELFPEFDARSWVSSQNSI